MRRVWKTLSLVSCVSAVALGAFASAQADASPEETQFKKSCGTCHIAEAGAPIRQGPNLWGVLGRKAATLGGFKFSDALKATDIVWDEMTLDQWITNAGKMVPGTTMMYRQRNAEKRLKIITYLKTRR